jgi:hypothetical protein
LLTSGDAKRCRHSVDRTSVYRAVDAQSSVHLRLCLLHEIAFQLAHDVVIFMPARVRSGVQRAAGNLIFGAP